MDKFFDIQQRADTQLFLIEGFLGYWPLVKEEVGFLLNHIAPNDDIEIHIDSMGGDPRTAMQIFRMLKAHPGKKICYVEGDCMSAVTLIPGACDEVISGPHSIWLIHKAEIEAGWMDDDKAKSVAEWIRIINEQMTEIYTEYTGQSSEMIETWMKETKVFNANEAVDLGFADRIEEIDERLVHSQSEDYRVAAGAYKVPREKLEGRASPETNPKHKSNTDMSDTNSQSWIKKMKAAVGLGDDKDEADTVLTIKELKARAEQADTLTQENETLQEENKKLQEKLDELEAEAETSEEQEEQAEVAAKETALQAAIDSFRIKASEKDAWLEDYQEKPSGKLKAALERIPEGACKPGGGSTPPTKPRTKASVGANLNPAIAKDLGIES